jgi:hypothetical protein
MSRKRMSLESRFLTKVGAVLENGCHPWVGATRGGYGVIGEGGTSKRMLYAHRVAWELANWPVPDGLCVCHRCDNPGCVNPKHLFLGIHRENMHDMLRKGRNRYKIPALRQGESCSAAKLTENDVRKIRDAHDNQHISQYRLAKQFGVGATCIGKIVRRESWKHV